MSATTPLPLTPRATFARRMLTVAWMSLLLGLFGELLLLLIAAAFGTASGAMPFLADAAQKVSWSTLVCTGITLGTAASRPFRATAMGLMGLLSAPLAFAVARAIHRAATQALGIDTAAGPSPVVLASIKGLEYACLGFAIGMISTRPWGGLRAHLVVGLCVAVVFGSMTLLYTVSQSTSVNPQRIVSLITNELIYPIGCALIQFSAGALGAQLVVHGE